ncbi:hypothetical protein P5V15_001327 [Pogonomyrmex californicus]
MADSLDEMTEKELARRLEQLGSEATGSKAVLREKLRKALSANTAEDAQDATNSAKGGSNGARSRLDREQDGGKRREFVRGGTNIDGMRRRDL